MKSRLLRSRLSAARLLVMLTLGAAAAAVLSPTWAAEAPVHVRGTIESVTASAITVKTADGDKTIALNAATKTVGVVPSSLDQIKPGTFIGTANVKRQGRATALEMVVFPDSMKGMGLGDYPWDLAPAGGSNMANGNVNASAMTNGTVTSRNHGGMAMHSSMTNGTVKKASNSRGMNLLVDYGKGKKTIHVPSDVPVVTFQPADRSALIKGAHVFVVAKPGTPMNAALVAVGINGTVPPM